MAKISATVVTLNEEENIRNCLESLRWCDEIIIVDSFSEDKTVEIAREYTDEIYTYPRTGYSEPAREKALEEASGDWICMIDADERIPDDLATKLRRAADEGVYDVIHAPRKNYILGQWMDCAGWWPDYRPVLYRQSVTELSEEIHNFLTFSNAHEKYLQPEERNAITHFNYDGIGDFINRMNRYTEVEGKQMDLKYRKFVTLPTKEFINRFFLEQGFRKGFTGLLLSIFMSWYRFLSVAKSWQYQSIGTDEEIQNKYENIDSK